MGTTVDVTVTGDSAIRGNSGIDVSGYGYAGGQGPGAGASGTSATGYVTSGGAHGGYGGNASNTNTATLLHPSGAPYDSYTQPVLPGSGGGGYDSAVGTAGGGVIHYTVNGTLLIDGSSYLRANGVNTTSQSVGAGSGGSILLTAGTLNGGGTISAQGGYSYYSSGGGGRIAFYSSAGTYAANIYAQGGIYSPRRLVPGRGGNRLHPVRRRRKRRPVH